MLRVACFHDLIDESVHLLILDSSPLMGLALLLHLLILDSSPLMGLALLLGDDVAVELFIDHANGQRATLMRRDVHCCPEVVSGVDVVVHEPRCLLTCDVERSSTRFVLLYSSHSKDQTKQVIDYPTHNDGRVPWLIERCSRRQVSMVSRSHSA